MHFTAILITPASVDTRNGGNVCGIAFFTHRNTFLSFPCLGSPPKCLSLMLSAIACLAFVFW